MIVVNVRPSQVTTLKAIKGSSDSRDMRAAAVVIYTVYVQISDGKNGQIVLFRGYRSSRYIKDKQVLPIKMVSHQLGSCVAVGLMVEFKDER